MLNITIRIGSNLASFLTSNPPKKEFKQSNTLVFDLVRFADRDTAFEDYFEPHIRLN